MFERIGSKIKGLASVIAWVGIMASILLGIVLCVSEMILIGLVVMVIGSLASWIGTFLLYGFGELIEKTCSIEEQLSLRKQIQSAKDAHISELDELLRQGIISEDEYREACSHE